MYILENTPEKVGTLVSAITHPIDSITHFGQNSWPVDSVRDLLNVHEMQLHRFVLAHLKLFINLALLLHLPVLKPTGRCVLLIVHPILPAWAHNVQSTTRINEVEAEVRKDNTIDVRMQVEKQTSKSKSQQLICCIVQWAQLSCCHFKHSRYQDQMVHCITIIQTK